MPQTLNKDLTSIQTKGAWHIGMGALKPNVIREIVLIWSTYIRKVFVKTYSNYSDNSELKDGCVYREHKLLNFIELKWWLNMIIAV